MVIKLQDYLTTEIDQLKEIGINEDLDEIATNSRKIILTKATIVLKSIRANHQSNQHQADDLDPQKEHYEPSILEEEFRLATEDISDLRQKLKVPNVQILTEDDPNAPKEVAKALNQGDIVAMTFHGVYGYIASGYNLDDSIDNNAGPSDIGEMRIRLLKERSRVLSAWGYLSVIPQIIDLDRVPKNLKKYIQDDSWLVRHCAQNGEETFLRIPVIRKKALAMGITDAVIGGDDTIHFIDFENAPYISHIQNAICGDDHSKIAIISSANKTTHRSLTAAVDVLAEIEEEEQRMVSILVKALPEYEGPTTEELKNRGELKAVKAMIQPINQSQIEEHIRLRVKSARELVSLGSSGRVEGSKPIWSFVKKDPAIKK